MDFGQIWLLHRQADIASRPKNSGNEFLQISCFYSAFKLPNCLLAIMALYSFGCVNMPGGWAVGLAASSSIVSPVLVEIRIDTSHGKSDHAFIYHHVPKYALWVNNGYRLQCG